jgi:L-alanine-DL-glutamate epimerase-like enolase superfamily enzyme
MIHVARACGLQILLGCMVSSSVSTTAAAQLSPLVDFADLDGHLLVSDDPWEGRPRPERPPRAPRPARPRTGAEGELAAAEVAAAESMPSAAPVAAIRGDLGRSRRGS